MGRAKTNRRAVDLKADVDMTPIIDVCFNLLIFFMTSMRFITPEGQIETFLPREGRAGFREGSSDEIRLKLLWVAEDGYTPVADPEAPGMCVLKIEQDYFPEIRYEGDPDPSPDFRALRAWLEDVRATTPDVPVIIDARTLVPWRYVVRTVNACLEAGIHEVTFAQPEVPY